MADKKISELDAITGANTAATDVFVVVDTSTGQTKKITREELNNAIEQDVLSSIDIDTINGDFSVNGNINLGDNNKAIFGAGSDLQIYHTGSDSVIQDAGQGDLYIKASNNFWFQGNTSNDIMARFQDNGAVTLYYDNSAKLATTSTGIDVTGTVTADGLTVQGDAYFDTNNAGRALHITRYGTVESESANFTIDDNDLVVESIQDEQYGGYVFKATHNGVGTRNRLDIANNGDISFYEDTGATAKLFWDASAEALGLGTSSPSYDLHIKSINTDNNGVFIQSSGSNNYGIYMKSAFAGVMGTVGALNQSDGARTGASMNFVDFGREIAFNTNAGASNAERMRIDSSGRVGIGTTSPDAPIRIDHDAVGTAFKVTGGNGGQNLAEFVRDIGADASINIHASGGDPAITFTSTGNTFSAGVNGGLFEIADNDALGTNTRFVITSAGLVGIGTSSPASKIHIQTASSGATVGGGGDELIVENSSTAGLSILSGASNDGNILFGDSGNSAAGYVQYKHGDDALAFGTLASERMRIDSSGNVLVGKTSDAFGTAGCELRPEGSLRITRNNSTAGFFNRLSSDGTIVEFYKDSSSVGKIGVNGSSLTVGRGSSGVHFYDGGTKIIVPANPSTGGDNDATVDLGYSSSRFRNLFLSSGVYLGGTGSANHLDDYEEGTWTPTVDYGTINVVRAVYTKVGRDVTVSATIQRATATSSANTLAIKGLPFQSGVNGEFIGAAMNNGADLHTESILCYMYGLNSTDEILIYSNRDNASPLSIKHNQFGANDYFYIQLTYSV